MLSCYSVENGITSRSLKLLTDVDLKELGFNMGQHRLVLQWIRDNTVTSPVATAPSTLPKSETCF